MNKDFVALRLALKRERQRTKELVCLLETERQHSSELERLLETEKANTLEVETKLNESECLARRQIEELNMAHKERDELSETVAYLKGNGLWGLVSDNAEIKRRVICEYLEALPSGISLLGSSGYTAITPIHKPKNLADAKRIAEKIIKS